MTAIAARQVTKAFGDVVAVDGASLDVERGEVIGLVGANGAGKTTLIKVILGLLAPDSGTVELAGGPPSRRTRRRVGYVPQGLGLWTDLTLPEHLSLSGDVYGHRPSGIRDGGLEAVAADLIGALPLGLRRRAAFEVALAHDPEVVILDEPTSGVDPLGRSRLWETIRGVADAGAGVLVSTHYLDEASRCDRIVLLVDGQVVAQGAADELAADREAVQVTSNQWEQAWQRLEAADLAVLPAGRRLRVSGADGDEVRAALGDLDAEVALAPATLEEVFLEVTARRRDG
ncbi:MAG: ABC transporter ATP-binding protein [Nitriliruptorales bacterium]|nr:ABC transporter ATP-binding protein [Nitriliruptorales bacterium]